MKTYLLFCTCFLLTALGALAQKNATDLLSPKFRVFRPAADPREGIMADSVERGLDALGELVMVTSIDKKALPNIVSRSSFRRIYRSDFSKISGTNDLPIGQVIVSLTKPAIQVGQLIPIYVNSTKSIPILGLYPYIKGKLNDDDEFRLGKRGEIDPGVAFGGKLVYFPAGKGRYTGYYHRPDRKTQLFVEKNDFLKHQVEAEYHPTYILNRIDELEEEIQELENQIGNREFLLDYLQNSPYYSTQILPDQVIIRLNRGFLAGQNEVIFNLNEIERVLSEKIASAGRIQSLRETPAGIEVTQKSQLTNVLTVSELVGKEKDLKKGLKELREKKFTKTEELLKFVELIKKDGTPDHIKIKKLKEDKVYEAEKNAPWTARHFLWFTVDGLLEKQTVNLFRNGGIEEDLKFNKNVVGYSANFAYFTKHWVFTIMGKYDYTLTNKFLYNDPINFLTDSLIANTPYRTSESVSAYDVSKLSDREFSEKQNRGIITLGGTMLYGVDKKFGLNINYRHESVNKVANLKLGAILPVILDNSKAEQSNIILELVLPDLKTKSVENVGKTPWQRRYYNLKVGIPINLL
jgi:hypothetical protein